LPSCSVSSTPSTHVLPTTTIRRRNCGGRSKPFEREGGNGIVIFDAGGLTSRRLWPVLEDLFKEPSIEPYRVASAAHMSIVRVRMVRQRLEAAQRGLWILGGVTVLPLAALAIIAWKSRSTA